MLSRFQFHEDKEHFKGYILLIAWGLVNDTCLILLLDAVDKVSPSSRDPPPHAADLAGAKPFEVSL